MQNNHKHQHEQIRYNLACLYKQVGLDLAGEEIRLKSCHNLAGQHMF